MTRLLPHGGERVFDFIGNSYEAKASGRMRTAAKRKVSQSDSPQARECAKHILFSTLCSESFIKILVCDLREKIK